MEFVSRTGDVHVHAVWLKAPDAVNRKYRSWLSEAEIARADRFVFAHLTRSYEISQGALRLLLAHSLNRRPQEVEFHLGPRGKPFLPGASRICFNLAHSGELALFALTLDVELGVDVEELRIVPDIEQIAARYFCPAETLELKRVVPGKPAMQAFFRCWTRKEAYIKAVGDGLYLPLDQFQVTLSEDFPTRFIHVGGDTEAASQWTLHHLDPAPNYIGALAYRDAPRNVRLHKPCTPERLLAELSDIC